MTEVHTEEPLFGGMRELCQQQHAYCLLDHVSGVIFFDSWVLVKRTHVLERAAYYVRLGQFGFHVFDICTKLVCSRSCFNLSHKIVDTEL